MSYFRKFVDFVIGTTIVHAKYGNLAYDRSGIAMYSPEVRSRRASQEVSLLDDVERFACWRGEVTFSPLGYKATLVLCPAEKRGPTERQELMFSAFERDWFKMEGELAKQLSQTLCRWLRIDFESLGLREDESARFFTDVVRVSVIWVLESSEDEHIAVEFEVVPRGPIDPKEFGGHVLYALIEDGRVQTVGLEG